MQNLFNLCGSLIIAQEIPFVKGKRKKLPRICTSSPSKSIKKGPPLEALFFYIQSFGVFSKACAISSSVGI